MTEAPRKRVDEARIERRLRRRYAAEKRFELYGKLAVGAALTALATLLVSIAWTGAGAFRHHRIVLDIEYDADTLGVSSPPSEAELSNASYTSLIRAALAREFPDVEGRRDRRDLAQLVNSAAGFELRRRILEDPGVLGTTDSVEFTVGDETELYLKGLISADLPESDRKINDKQIAWITALEDRGRIESGINTRFFTNGDSREPELAGLGGAFVGSVLTLLITLALSFPIGVATAVYLEVFAPKNRWTDLIEVNINNLAAVPSIVFGLLGLAVLLNVFGLPRSAPVAGGCVLALMTLPTIIIAARAALKAVPPSVAEAAMGLGASPLEVIFHHVLPLAMPGILTGSIIGMAQALGETAPLLMIGMVAFIVDIPGGVTSPATVLPVQIYLWADSPERLFVEKTAGAIVVLLALLIAMNSLATVLRRKYERRW